MRLFFRSLETNNELKRFGPESWRNVEDWSLITILLPRIFFDTSDDMRCKLRERDVAVLIGISISMKAIEEMEGEQSMVAVERSSCGLTGRSSGQRDNSTFDLGRAHRNKRSRPCGENASGAGSRKTSVKKDNDLKKGRRIKKTRQKSVKR